MTRDQLKDLYKDLWVKTRTSLPTFDSLDAQLAKAKHPEKCVVACLITDTNPEKKRVDQVNLALKVFAARKKNGEWRFSEDKEDVDFVMAEISGLSVADYRAKRDAHAKEQQTTLLQELCQ